MTGWKMSKKKLLKKFSRVRKPYTIKIRFLCQNCLFISNQHSILSGDACRKIPHCVIKVESKVTLILTPTA